VHKRRLKELRDPAYTVEESERAAGRGVDNRQRGVEDVVRRFETAGLAQTRTTEQIAKPNSEAAPLA
jgi:bud site selection protein 20